MIPFVELKTQYRELEEELRRALDGLFDSCQFVLGEPLEAFEREFAEYIEAGHVIGVGSGTDALHLSLLESGVGPGDEVIVPAFSFVATALAVTYTGARPVFADIDPDSFNIDSADAEQRITERTRAIIPVHLYGQPADMDRVAGLAGKHGLAVIEDGCQAHGARFGGRRVGTFGTSGCFSFYPGKNLGAYGDGGAVVTNDAGVAERLRLLRNYGQREKYTHETIGYNSRLDCLQAVVLSVKLRRLDKWNARRRELAGIYDELLSGRVRTPAVLPNREHVYHVYAIRVPERDSVLASLLEAGVGASIHYPVPIHLQPVYSGLGCKAGDYPVSEDAASTVLSLPMYPEMTNEAAEEVAAKVLDIIGR